MREVDDDNSRIQNRFLPLLIPLGVRVCNVAGQFHIRICNMC